MFNSQCLLSRKGPLRTIWVAAYYFKKLKKSQISETDISSSVDKLLQDEFEALTYRVLAYLLLGIVRIYSKKVEYLYEDCNEVLVQIKDFVVKKKNKAQLDIPSASYFSITLPERFELDAFDLEILEDANEKNVRSQEEITLKDVEWDSQGSGQFFMDKYHSEDFGVSCSTFPIDLSNEEDELELQLMNFDKEAGTSVDLDKLDEIIEKIRCDGSFKVGSSFCGSFFRPEEELPDPVKSHDKKYHSDHEHEEVCEVASVEHCTSKEANSCENDGRFSPEERVNLHGEDEAEPLAPCEPCGEDRTNEEKIDDQNTEPVEIIMQAMEVENNLSILVVEAGTKKLQDDNSPHADLEVPSELDKPSGGDDQPDVEQKIPQEETCSKKRKRKVSHEDLSLSVTVNATPKTKLSDASGTTPKYMLIPTPAIKESARFSRKRTCLFDEMIVYPNKVFKEWLNDSSDLLRERKRGVNNTRAAQTMRFTATSVYDFCKPLLPCPPEVIPLHYGKKSKVQHYIEISNSPEKRDVPAPIKLPENMEIPAPIELPEDLEVPAPARAVENMEVSSPPIGGTSEQRDIAPQTPVRCSTTLRSFGRLKHGNEDIKDEPIEEVVIAHSTEKDANPSLTVEASTNKEKDPSASKEQEVNSTEKDDKEPAPSLTVEASTSKKKDPSASKEQEVNSTEKGDKEPAPSLTVEASTSKEKGPSASKEQEVNSTEKSDKEPAPSLTVEASTSKEQEVNSTEKSDKEPAPSLSVEASAHPIGNEEKDPSVSREQEFNSSGKDDKEPAPSLSIEASAHPIGNEEKDPSVSREQEVNSSGKDDKEPAGPAPSLSVEASAHPIGNEEKDPSVSRDLEINSTEKDDKEPAPSLTVEASAHPIGNEEKDPSVSREQEVNSSGKVVNEPSVSIDAEASTHLVGTEEKGSSVSKDQEVDLNFMSKDEFSCDSDNQGQDGWSERTRLVAKFLSRSFLDKKSRGEEEKVNLLSIARGKTKKESARLFYEILVLKTKDFVEVEQVDGFSDILVSKTARCDQAFAI